MAIRTWGRVLLTSLGVSILVGAGQLGIAYGFGVVSFGRAFSGGIENQWHAHLAWIAWFATVAAVLGAIVADRAARRLGHHGGLPALAGLALASSTGAAAVALITMPAARAAQLTDGTDPAGSVGRAALLGALAGLPLAVLALWRRPYAWAVVCLAAVVWLLAVGSAAPSLAAGQDLPAVRLGVLDAAALTTGLVQRLTVVVMPSLALITGAAIGAIAHRRAHHTAIVATSGLLAPAPLAVAYLAAGPGTAADAYQAAPFWGSLVALAAGALGSLLAVVVDRPTPPPAPVRPEPAADPAPPPPAPAAAPPPPDAPDDGPGPERPGRRGPGGSDPQHPGGAGPKEDGGPGRSGPGGPGPGAPGPGGGGGSGIGAHHDVGKPTSAGTHGSAPDSSHDPVRPDSPGPDPGTRDTARTSADPLDPRTPISSIGSTGTDKPVSLGKTAISGTSDRPGTKDDPLGEDSRNSRDSAPISLISPTLDDVLSPKERETQEEGGSDMSTPETNGGDRDHQRSTPAWSDADPSTEPDVTDAATEWNGTGWSDTERGGATPHPATGAPTDTPPGLGALREPTGAFRQANWSAAFGANQPWEVDQSGREPTPFEIADRARRAETDRAGAAGEISPTSGGTPVAGTDSGFPVASDTGPAASSTPGSGTAHVGSPYSTGTTASSTSDSGTAHVGGPRGTGTIASGPPDSGTGTWNSGTGTWTGDFGTDDFGVTHEFRTIGGSDGGQAGHTAGEALVGEVLPPVSSGAAATDPDLTEPGAQPAFDRQRDAGTELHDLADGLPGGDAERHGPADGDQSTGTGRSVTLDFATSTEPRAESPATDGPAARPGHAGLGAEAGTGPRAASGGSDTPAGAPAIPPPPAPGPPPPLPTDATRAEATAPLSTTPTSGAPSAAPSVSANMPVSGAPISAVPVSGASAPYPVSAMPVSGASASYPFSGVPASGVPTSEASVAGTPTSGIPSAQMPTAREQDGADASGPGSGTAPGGAWSADTLAPGPKRPLIEPEFRVIPPDPAADDSPTVASPVQGAPTVDAPPARTLAERLAAAGILDHNDLFIPSRPAQPPAASAPEQPVRGVADVGTPEEHTRPAGQASVWGTPPEPARAERPQPTGQPSTEQHFAQQQPWRSETAAPTAQPDGWAVHQNRQPQPGPASPTAPQDAWTARPDENRQPQPAAPAARDDGWAAPPEWAGGDDGRQQDRAASTEGAGASAPDSPARVFPRIFEPLEPPAEMPSLFESAMPATSAPSLFEPVRQRLSEPPAEQTGPPSADDRPVSAAPAGTTASSATGPASSPPTGPASQQQAEFAESWQRHDAASPWPGTGSTPQETLTQPTADRPYGVTSPQPAPSWPQDPSGPGRAAPPESGTTPDGQPIAAADGQPGMPARPQDRSSLPRFAVSRPDGGTPAAGSVPPRFADTGPQPVSPAPHVPDSAVPGRFPLDPGARQPDFPSRGPATPFPADAHPGRPAPQPVNPADSGRSEFPVARPFVPTADDIAAQPGLVSARFSTDPANGTGTQQVRPPTRPAVPTADDIAARPGLVSARFSTDPAHAEQPGHPAEPDPSRPSGESGAQHGDSTAQPAQPQPAQPTQLGQPGTPAETDATEPGSGPSRSTTGPADSGARFSFPASPVADAGSGFPTSPAGDAESGFPTSPAATGAGSGFPTSPATGAESGSPASPAADRGSGFPWSAPTDARPDFSGPPSTDAPSGFPASPRTDARPGVPASPPTGSSPAGGTAQPGAYPGTPSGSAYSGLPTSASRQPTSAFAPDPAGTTAQPNATPGPTAAFPQPDATSGRTSAFPQPNATPGSAGAAPQPNATPYRAAPYPGSSGSGGPAEAGGAGRTGTAGRDGRADWSDAGGTSGRDDRGSGSAPVTGAGSGSRGEPVHEGVLLPPEEPRTARGTWAAPDGWAADDAWSVTDEWTPAAPRSGARTAPSARDDGWAAPKAPDPADAGPARAATDPAGSWATPRTPADAWPTSKTQEPADTWPAPETREPADAWPAPRTQKPADAWPTPEAQQPADAWPAPQGQEPADVWSRRAEDAGGPWGNDPGYEIGAPTGTTPARPSDGPAPSGAERGPAVDAEPAAKPEKRRRGLFRRRSQQAQPPVAEAVPLRDEEYVDWVSGLGDRSDED